jgi:hypothetical protein
MGRKIIKAILLVLIAEILGAGSLACLSRNGRTEVREPATKTASNDNASSNTQDKGGVIRKVDFANFTYPWIAEVTDPLNPKKELTLHSGNLEPVRDNRNQVVEMGASLEGVVHGDLTGDGKEDAVVVLAIRTGAQAMPRALYVYSADSDKTRLLWTSTFGDRADGGFRKVEITNGLLVIERYSPKESKGACCPIYFTRQSYEWTLGAFRPTGKPEVLPNRDGHSSPVMPRPQEPPLR